MPPPPMNDEERQKNKESEQLEVQNGDNMDLTPQMEKKGGKEQPRVSSTTCKPVAAERSKVEFPSHRINAQIQYMRDHALIGKFIGIWSNKKALWGWIAVKWSPKGNITLQLRPKGFFTAIFNYLEDRNMVLDGGPYFFNAANLYLRGWVERFNPDKEDLS